MPKAVSRYKQVRITITEELCPGHPGLRNLSMRVLAKPLDAAWTERHTVLVDSRRQCQPLATIDDVYVAVLEFLAAPPLPGHIG